MWSWFPWIGIVALMMLIVLMAVRLIGPIVHPTILAYPWPLADQAVERKRDKQQTVVLAGSYNPPHKGHLAMILYLAERYVVE